MKNKLGGFLSVLGKILLSLLILVIILAGVLLAQFFYRSNPDGLKQYETTNPHISGTTNVSAHRAGSGIMPEETMMAFKNCVEDPNFEVDVFEFDLHLTADGVLVLLHDNNLDRTSDSEYVFGKTDVLAGWMNYRDLRTLNMGAKFTDENGNMPFADLHGEDVPDDLRIVSLSAALDYLESKGQFNYIIEIKDPGRMGMRGVDILYATLKERDMLDRVVFGSFHGEVSRYKDKQYPDLLRGAFAGEVVDFYLAAITNKADYEPPCAVLQLPFNIPAESYGLNFGLTSVINYAHAHDMAVQYWTVNDVKDMEYLISIGADCIMSDYPDKLYHVRESLK